MERDLVIMSVQEEVKKNLSKNIIIIPQNQNHLILTNILLTDAPYSLGEIIWGVFLLCSICVVNGLVLWVVSNSRELREKPRHMWMACLCVTDILVATHKGLELFIIIWPLRELCILKRTTLGIPYVVNVSLLALLSIDRFVAVRYPFYYSNYVSVKHVQIGFSMVLIMGVILTTLSMSLGMSERICRPQRIQLIIVTTLLTICSILIFLCNAYVLRVAKRQIDAIRSQTVKTIGHQETFDRQLMSRLYCQNLCRQTVSATPTPTPQPSRIGNFSIPSEHNDDDSVDTTFQMPGNLITLDPNMENDNDSMASSSPEQLSLALGPPAFPGCSMLPISLPISMPGNLLQPVILPQSDLNVKIEIQSCHPHETMSILEATFESHHISETLTPLSRAISMPSLPRSENVILVVPADPTIKTTAKILSSGSSTDEGIDQERSINSEKINPSLNKIHLNKFSQVSHTIKVSLPRSRSFTGGKKFSTINNRPERHNFLKNFHLTGAPGLSHAWRLMPSMRFANTVLLIMIPMWLFLAPIVIIIPMQRYCLDQKSDMNCDAFNEFWVYLQIHMRSVLPFQAVLDTLIYACASKEFRRAFNKTCSSFKIKY